MCSTAAEIRLVGATLDLNGHTVTCTNQDAAVAIGDGGTVVNGTVKNCRVYFNGIHGKVAGVKVVGGPGIRSEGYSLGNRLMGNTVIGGAIVMFGRGHTLIGNIVRNSSDVGFYLTLDNEPTITVVRGNAASGNPHGGFFARGTIHLVGNVAENNGGPGIDANRCVGRFVTNTVTRNMVGQASCSTIAAPI